MLHAYKGRTLFATLVARASLPASSTTVRSISSDNNPKMKLALGPVERKPFIKELFIGNFDKRFLTFPEILDEEQVDSITAMHDTVFKFMTEKVDSAKLDNTEIVPDEVINGLRELGLFGQQVDPDYGGLGLTATEYVRLNEAIGLDGALTTTLMAHNSIGIKGIIMYGTEAQKKKYLPKIASGEYIASFALTEPNSGSDAASITTSARLSPDGKHYILNGQKLYITNGAWADVMTVFARNDTLTEKLGKTKLTAFIVEKSFGGITTGKAESKLGIKASNTVPVFFENVMVPVENILHNEEDGFKVAVNILNTGRFGMAGALAGAARVGLNQSIAYATQRKQFKRNISEFELIQKKFAQLAQDIYAMESMAYMTTAIVDNVKDADYPLEAACVKIFASEAALRCASEFIQIHGGSGFLKHLPFERGFRDARITMIFEGTNEILRMLVALLGIQHASDHLKQMMKIWGNPVGNPKAAFNKLVDRFRDHIDSPALTLGLRYAVHHTLADEGQNLEYCAKRLQYLVEWSLQKYGKNVIEQQMLLERIADIVIDIYAVTAVLARASRTLQLRAQSSPLDTALAQAFCYDAQLRIKQNVAEALKGDTDNNFARYRLIAGHMFKKGQYDALHPLARS
ncbi:acyl-CoA dehydrogenase family member 9, mitochondrial-like isoform X2 [Varroa destructor]|nr:acyl-CoA dehydrogenase family member 9, mitochondrial-like isoform X2 [Varroa destructor]